ncbi:MAG: bacterioferritin [Planctomycetota bacterium]|nr:bacterioferritin [Planctomycetaceae bacterium]MDQ3332024.1 bacterioferritin [Planctomycetota bacterium]
MKGSQKVIDALNAGLTVELTAINLYFINSKMCQNWGLNHLAKHFYDESIEEMLHAQKVIDRILFLDGVPEIARYDVIKVGKTPEEQIRNSLELETKGQVHYNEAMRIAVEEKDNGSRELMEQLLIETEESIDWCEAQLDLIKFVGIERYLAQRMGSVEIEGSPTGNE